MNKKSILIINYEYPPLGGGAATQCKYLAEGLSAQGYKITVLTSLYDGLEGLESLNDSLTIVRVKSFRKSKGQCSIIGMVSFVFFAFVKLLSLMRGDKPDACICFFGIPCGPLAYFLKKFYGLPYLLSLRGGDVPGANKTIEAGHKFLAPINRAVWKSAYAVVVNSKKLEGLAKSFCRDINYKIIYNGIDTAVFKPLEMTKENATLYVGRLDADKNVEWMFDCFIPEVIKYDNTMRFTIVGEGPLKELLVNKAVSGGFVDKVSFVGWLDRNLLPEVYNRHKFLIQPSLSEGMSNVLMEAKACGLRCVALDIPENRELLDQEQDVMVMEGVVDRFSDSIKSLFEFNDTYGEAGSLSADYSVVQMVKGYEELAMEVL